MCTAWCVYCLCHTAEVVPICRKKTQNYLRVHKGSPSVTRWYRTSAISFLLLMVQSQKCHKINPSAVPPSSYWDRFRRLTAAQQSADTVETNEDRRLKDRHVGIFTVYVRVRLFFHLYWHNPKKTFCKLFLTRMGYNSIETCFDRVDHFSFPLKLQLMDVLVA